MFIPTEPIGSIPRPPELLSCIREFHCGHVSAETLQAEYDAALRDTVLRFEATGSPVISDGEQSKPSFATYPLADLPNIAADGLKIPFADGHSRQLPRLTAGPFRYGVHADRYLLRLRKPRPVGVEHKGCAYEFLRCYNLILS